MNSKKSHPKSVILACAVSGLMCSTGSAAVITWGSAVNVTTGVGNSADVSTNGTLVEAFNGAGTGYTDGDQVVNGVSFVATTALLSLDLGSIIDFSTGTNGGDAAYDAILSTVDFGGGDSTTITVGDGDGDTTLSSAGLLMIGQLYEIQVWFVDDRASSDTRTMGFASGGSDPSVGLNDQFAIGTFTADATTQDLFLDTVSPASGFGNAHITAYQIRQIPEPSSILLTALSVIGLLLRRRR